MAGSTVAGGNVDHQRGQLFYNDAKDIPHLCKNVRNLAGHDSLLYNNVDMLLREITLRSITELSDFCTLRPVVL